jgi:triosephosphate isomerase (TIM)
MLRGMVNYVILGHSERRRYFHETNQEVANTVSEALAAGIKPIVCVDQPYLRAQIAALNDTDCSNLIIGYGPVEAIGIDIPQSPEKTMAVVGKIRTMIPGCPILYGSSISTDNTATYIALAEVSGLLIGSASLEPE